MGRWSTARVGPSTPDSNHSKVFLAPALFLASSPTAVALISNPPNSKIPHDQHLVKHPWACGMEPTPFYSPNVHVEAEHSIDRRVSECDSYKNPARSACLLMRKDALQQQAVPQATGHSPVQLVTVQHEGDHICLSVTIKQNRKRKQSPKTR